MLLTSISLLQLKWKSCSSFIQLSEFYIEDHQMRAVFSISKRLVDDGIAHTRYQNLRLGVPPVSLRPVLCMLHHISNAVALGVVQLQLLLQWFQAIAHATQPLCHDLLLYWLHDSVQQAVQLSQLLCQDSDIPGGWCIRLLEIRNRTIHVWF